MGKYRKYRKYSYKTRQHDRDANLNINAPDNNNIGTFNNCSSSRGSGRSNGSKRPTGIPYSYFPTQNPFPFPIQEPPVQPVTSPPSSVPFPAPGAGYYYRGNIGNSALSSIIPQHCTPPPPPPYIRHEDSTLACYRPSPGSCNFAGPNYGRNRMSSLPQVPVSREMKDREDLGLFLEQFRYVGEQRRYEPPSCKNNPDFDTQVPFAPLPMSTGTIHMDVEDKISQQEIKRQQQRQQQQHQKHQVEGIEESASRHFNGPLIVTTPSPAPVPAGTGTRTSRLRADAPEFVPQDPGGGSHHKNNNNHGIVNGGNGTNHPNVYARGDRWNGYGCQDRAILYQW